MNRPDIEFVMISDREIEAVLARLDGTLRDMGVPARTGACQCGRCERAHAAPAAAADAPAPATGPTHPPIAKPAPAPRAPRPGGAAVRMPAPVAEIVF
jgi:hypothetical protein